MRALTLAAMCTAGLVSTVGISGSTSPSATAKAPADQTTAHHAPTR
jgi:hypothetical protein